MDQEQQTTNFVVVVNHEEQYSIWPSHKSIPGGWTVVGSAQDKESCLQHIEKLWVDMRPLSLRRSLMKSAQGD